MQIEPEEIGALLETARKRTRASRAVASQWAGVSEGTIQNWEEANNPSALRLAIYLRELAARSSLARKFVLQILGLETVVEEEQDERLEWKLDLVRAAHQHDSGAVRKLLETMEEVMEMEARVRDLQGRGA